MSDSTNFIYLPADGRVRETIAAAAPGAEEGITYGMPGFLLDGRGLVGYMAFERHYSFFPMSPAAIDAHREELGDLVTGKGTISLEYGRRLPVKLVKAVVKTRLAEVAAKQRKRPQRSIKLRARSRCSRRAVSGPSREAAEAASKDPEDPGDRVEGGAREVDRPMDRRGHRWLRRRVRCRSPFPSMAAARRCVLARIGSPPRTR